MVSRDGTRVAETEASARGRITTVARGEFMRGGPGTTCNRRTPAGSTMWEEGGTPNLFRRGG